MMRITVAGLLAAAWLTAQTGTAPAKPTDPGVLHPMPIPKTSPQPVPPGTQPDPNTKHRAGKSQSQKSGKTTPREKKSPDAGVRKQTESPKSKTETRP